jgi:hypothetical protein
LKYQIAPCPVTVLMGRARSDISTFRKIIVYFGVHSTAMHSKISLNQKKNPLFLISGAPVATSMLDLLRRETAWPKNGLFFLLFVYFGVHSTAMHSKISLNQKKNPLFLTSGAPVATSMLSF